MSAVCEWGMTSTRGRDLFPLWHIFTTYSTEHWLTNAEGRVVEENVDCAGVFSCRKLKFLQHILFTFHFNWHCCCCSCAAVSSPFKCKADAISRIGAISIIDEWAIVRPLIRSHTRVTGTGLARHWVESEREYGGLTDCDFY